MAVIGRNITIRGGILPSVDLEINNVNEGTFAAGSTIDMQLTDGTDPVTPDSVTLVGDTLTVAVPSGGVAPVGATLMKTGQTTSYRTGDDGDVEAGRDVDFFTLASNNPFGNTDRFTDELGGQTYTNDIVIDWSTYNGSTVLGWRRTDNGVNINWNNSVDEALSLSIGTFTSGWRLPNVIEMFSLCRFSTVAPLNYAPFNLTISYAYWTSTSNGQSSNNAIEVFNSQNTTISGQSNKISTINARRYLPVRTFTVTGTTLT